MLDTYACLLVSVEKRVQLAGTPRLLGCDSNSACVQDALLLLVRSK